MSTLPPINQQLNAGIVKKPDSPDIESMPYPYHDPSMDPLLVRHRVDRRPLLRPLVDLRAVEFHRHWPLEVLSMRLREERKKEMAHLARLYMLRVANPYVAPEDLKYFGMVTSFGAEYPPKMKEDEDRAPTLCNDPISETASVTDPYVGQFYRQKPTTVFQRLTEPKEPPVVFVEGEDPCEPHPPYGPAPPLHFFERISKPKPQFYQEVPPTPKLHHHAKYSKNRLHALSRPKKVPLQPIHSEILVGMNKTQARKIPPEVFNKLAAPRHIVTLPQKVKKHYQHETPHIFHDPHK